MSKQIYTHTEMLTHFRSTAFVFAGPFIWLLIYFPFCTSILFIETEKDPLKTMQTREKTTYKIFEFEHARM